MNHHFTECLTFSPWDLETYLGSFKESQEWAIAMNTTQRFEKSRDVGVLLKFSRRTALRFSLTLSRRLGYTCHLLMMPCIFLVSMTLVVFCLPPERPDRHSLGEWFNNTNIIFHFFSLTRNSILRFPGNLNNQHCL